MLSKTSSSDACDFFLPVSFLWQLQGEPTSLGCGAYAISVPISFGNIAEFIFFREKSGAYAPDVRVNVYHSNGITRQSTAPFFAPRAGEEEMHQALLEDVARVAHAIGLLSVCDIAKEIERWIVMQCPKQDTQILENIFLDAMHAVIMRHALDEERARYLIEHLSKEQILQKVQKALTHKAKAPVEAKKRIVVSSYQPAPSPYRKRR